MRFDPAIDAPFLVMGGLSLVGASVVFFSFFVIRALQQRTLMRLVFYMSCCDFLFAFAFFVPSASGIRSHLQDEADAAPPNAAHPFSDADQAYCEVQGFISNVAGTGSLLWYLVIAVHALLALAGENVAVNLLYLKRYQPYYHVFVWGYSLSASLLVFAVGEYGSAGDGSCWIRGDRDPLRLLFYLPLACTFVVASVLLWRVRKLRVGFERVGAVSAAGSFSRMILFVIAFFVVWSSSFVLRVYNIFSKADPPAALLVIHRCCISSCGFVNCVIWLTSPAFARLHMAIRRCCPCCARIVQDPSKSTSMLDEEERDVLTHHDLDSGLARHPSSHNYSPPNMSYTPEDVDRLLSDTDSSALSVPRD